MNIPNSKWVAPILRFGQTECYPNLGRCLACAEIEIRDLLDLIKAIEPLKRGSCRVQIRSSSSCLRVVLVNTFLGSAERKSTPLIIEIISTSSPISSFLLLKTPFKFRYTNFKRTVIMGYGKDDELAINTIRLLAVS